MRNIWLLICVILSIAYAIPTEVEMASILSQPALGSAYSTTTFTITVLDTIFEGYPELIGRSYTVTVDKSADAFFIHTDGYALSEQSITNQSVSQQVIYENIQEQLLKDMGRIEHVREFGKEPEDTELGTYYSYSLARYGGKESLTSLLLNKHAQGSLSVSQLSQQFQVKNGGTTTAAKLIETGDGLALLKTDGTGFPSVELSSVQSDTSGDTVYVASQDKSEPDIFNIQTSIVGLTGANNEKITTTTAVKAPYFIIDPKGRILGFGFSKSKDNLVISSAKLKQLFEKNNIAEKSSAVNDIYKDAVNAYFDGDYGTAREKFEETLIRYPSHAGALKNLKLAEDALSNKNLISSAISSLLKFVSSLSKFQIAAILSIAFMLLIVFVFFAKKLS